jgi:calcyphosin
MKYYDLDKDGNVSYEEFIRGLREELTPRRAKMVHKVFNMLDRDGTGQVTVRDIIGVYDVSLNAEFIERRKTKDQILSEFLNNFEGARGNRDGAITKDEFVDYYTDISMNLPSDEYFVRMMESTW